MERNDILGDDGRTAIHAVVKVSIFKRWKYTRNEVEGRLCACFMDPPVKSFPSVLPDRENTGKSNCVYDIGDIHEALSKLLKMEETKTSRSASKKDEDEINKARRDIEREYKESLSSHRVEKVSLEKGYESINEPFPFSEANKPVEITLEQISQREVVDDLNTFLSDSSDHKIPPVSQDTDCDDEDDASPDDEENRTESLDSEAWVEDDHGSGFIVGNNLIITAKHVVEGAKKILISNAVIGELPCDVVEEDKQNDLVLLYCEKLDVEKSGIRPLELSKREPLQGVPIFTLGYPITHTGKAALFVKGYVAGKTGERFAREPLLTCNIPVYNGNSGGPTFWRCEEDKLKVVAVVKEKHLKRIFSSEEESFIEQIRSKLESMSFHEFLTPDNDLQKAFNMLKLSYSLLSKLLDSVAKNCPSYLANAIRGRFVLDLISDYKKKG